MSLRLRLIFSFIGVASLVFIVGVVGIVTAKQIANSADVIINSASPALNALGQIEAAGNNMRETAIHHALFKRIGVPSIENQEYTNARLELYKHMAELKVAMDKPELYGAIDAAVTEFTARTRNLIDRVNLISDDTTIYKATEAIDDAESAFQSAVDAAVAQEQAEFQLNIQQAQNTASSAVAINIIAIVLVMLAALVLGLIIARPHYTSG